MGIAMTVKEPVAEHSLLFVTAFLEERYGCLVVSGNDSIKLVQMDYPQGIVAQCLEGSTAVALSALAVHDDNAGFSTQVLRVEVYEVADAHGLPCPILYHQPHLAVCINIVTAGGYIVMKGVTGIRYVGGADIPEMAVVLYLIKQVEVFRLDGPETYFRSVHASGLFCG